MHRTGTLLKAKVVFYFKFQLESNSCTEIFQ